MVDLARLFTLQLTKSCRHFCLLDSVESVESVSASELLNFVISLTWHELLFETAEGRLVGVSSGVTKRIKSTGIISRFIETSVLNVAQGKHRN